MENNRNYYQTPGNNDRGGLKKGDIFSWLLIVILLASFWPLGLFLLIRQLMKMDRSRPSIHPYDIQHQSAQTTAAGAAAVKTPASSRRTNQRKNKLPDLKKGKGMTIAGSVLTGLSAFGMLNELVSWWGDWSWALEEMVEFLPLLAIGAVLMTFGIRWRRKNKRFRKYLALIGKHKNISVNTLAQAMPISVSKACDDLQEMLDEGILDVGYLDMGRKELILTNEGIRDEPEPRQEKKKKPEPEVDMDDDNAVLGEIRQVNDAIRDEAMSRKIDRIGDITSKIFTYQKQNPGKASELRSFLNYYLPTTLKILKAYAQMEAQGIEGENIRQTKERIEGMMDKVVEGYEKQLDRLFQDSAMDITSDVEVLERMLEKDGLSKNQGMTI